MTDTTKTYDIENGTDTQPQNAAVYPQYPAATATVTVPDDPYPGASPYPAAAAAAAAPTDDAYAGAYSVGQPATPTTPASYPAPEVPPAQTTVTITGPYVSGVSEIPYVAPPNRVMKWFVAGGALNGLCIGYAVLALLSFLVMCIAAAANNTFYAGFGWQIFCGLQSWLYCTVLAVMFGWKKAYTAIMQAFKALTPEVRQWIWIFVNFVQFVWWLSCFAQAASWTNLAVCGSNYGFVNEYLNGLCGKISATTAFAVFAWLGWTASFTFALLEKFLVRVTGTVGWAPDAGTAVAAAAPVEKPVPVAMSSLDGAEQGAGAGPVNY